MDEFVKLVKHFVYRDLAYVAGGCSIIAAFLYGFNQVTLLQGLSTAGVLLTAAMGYAIGYAVQDGLSMTRLLTTSMVDQPGAFVRSLYEKLERRPWKRLEPEQAINAHDKVFAEDPNGRFVGELLRIETLIVIGTALGSSGVVSGLLLGFKACQSVKADENDAWFNTCMAMGALLVGAVLMCLGWVKAAQLAQESVRYAERLGSTGSGANSALGESSSSGIAAT